jgi:hypothetical protein
MTADFSSLPVTRDQIDSAIRQFLGGQEPGFEIVMVHPDGTSKNEISISIPGSDNIQGFILQLAVIVTNETSVFVDGELILNKELIIDTFYGYTKKMTETAGKPGWFTVTLDFEPDLFTALMSDPSLGLI